jgi:CDP-glycerol glycerophosphotransferase
MVKVITYGTYDYDQYEEARGLYFDIRKVLLYAATEKNLLQLIKDGYTDTQKDAVLKFQQKYAPIFGHGTSNTVDLIYDNVRE